MCLLTVLACLLPFYKYTFHPYYIDSTCVFESTKQIIRRKIQALKNECSSRPRVNAVNA